MTPGQVKADLAQLEARLERLQCNGIDSVDVLSFFSAKKNRGKHPWVFVLNLAANNKVEITWEIFVFLCFCLFVLGVRKVDVYWKLFVNQFGKSWLLFCSR